MVIYKKLYVYITNSLMLRIIKNKLIKSRQIFLISIVDYGVVIYSSIFFNVMWQYSKNISLHNIHYRINIRRSKSRLLPISA